MGMGGMALAACAGAPAQQPESPLIGDNFADIAPMPSPGRSALASPDPTHDWIGLGTGHRQETYSSGLLSGLS